MNRNWSWTGETYPKDSSSQKIREHTALKKIAIRKNAKILDCGCGPGDTTFFMAQQADSGKVIGIDKDASMITKAKEFEQKTKNVTFMQMDMMQLQFEHKFDLITAFFSLQWLPSDKLEGVFNNIDNLLEENGTLCILLPCIDTPFEIIMRVAFSEKWKNQFENYREPQTFLDPSFYRQLLEKMNFESSTVELVESKHLLTDQEFIDYTRHWCGYYRFPTDPSVRKQFIEDIMTELKLRPHNDKDQFEMTQQSIEIIATKPVLENEITFNVNRF